MKRAYDFTPKTKTVNILLLDGGVGDHIASMVALDYLNKQYPWIKTLSWMPDYLVEIARHLMPNQEINGFSDMKGRYEPTRPTKTTKWDGHTSPMKIHGVDYAFLRLLDENPGIEYKNYLQIRPDEIRLTEDQTITSKYVVITTAYTAKVREFPGAEVNKVVAWLLQQNLSPVFLGQTSTKTGTQHTIKGVIDEEIDFSKGINLVDKTTLLQAAKIMAKAEAVIGVDNGLLHVAGCTKVPIIGGFTTVNPELRMPIRDNILGYGYLAVVPDQSLPCSFCQVKTNFLFGHNYTDCMYKDYLCTAQMTAEKFIWSLKVTLNLF